MVQVRGDAGILRFPLEDRNGLVVNLDVAVTTDLHSFITECADILEDESVSARSSAIL